MDAILSSTPRPCQAQQRPYRVMIRENLAANIRQCRAETLQDADALAEYVNDVAAALRISDRVSRSALVHWESKKQFDPNRVRMFAHAFGMTLQDVTQRVPPAGTWRNGMNSMLVTIKSAKPSSVRYQGDVWLPGTLVWRGGHVSPPLSAETRRRIIPKPISSASKRMVRWIDWVRSKISKGN